MSKIEESLTIFFDIEKQVREHINTHRYQKVLISELDNWNQICSSLDTLGDTGLALQSYFKSGADHTRSLFIHPFLKQRDKNSLIDLASVIK